MRKLFVRLDCEDDPTSRSPEFVAVPAGAVPTVEQWSSGRWVGEFSVEGYVFAEIGLDVVEPPEGSDVWLRVPLVGLWPVFEF